MDGFQTHDTEIRAKALNYWAIRQCFNLQLQPFIHSSSISTFAQRLLSISVVALVSHHTNHSSTSCKGIQMHAAEWNDVYNIQNWAKAFWVDLAWIKFKHMTNTNCVGSIIIMLSDNDFVLNLHPTIYISSIFTFTLPSTLTIIFASHNI